MSQETVCRCNPSAEGLLVCRRCQDTRRVTLAERADGAVPCPLCGDPQKHADLAREKLARTAPALKIRDLTPDEKVQVLDWTGRGIHELDALRWIEGRRYDPEKDAAFLRDCAKALRRSHFLHGQDGDPIGAVEIETRLPKEVTP